MHERTTTLIDTGDLTAPVGSVAWTTAVHFEAKGVLNDNEASRKLVEQWVGGLRKDNHFRCLKDSKGRNYLLWSSFCKDRQPWGLGYSEQAINAILAEREERESLTSAERSKIAADQTTGEVLPRGGDQKSESGKSISKLHIDTQLDRASQSNISRRTQIKIDRLARDFPELHAQVKAGALSVNAASMAAGIAKPVITLPGDPQEAARRILNRFQGEPLLELIRVLANHAGFNLTPRE